MATSTVFAARINIFDSQEITTLSLAFSIRNADTTPDGGYLIQ